MWARLRNSNRKHFHQKSSDMDLTFSNEDRAFQQEVRDWLEQAGHKIGEISSQVVRLANCQKQIWLRGKND